MKSAVSHPFKPVVFILLWLTSFAVATDYPYTVTDDLGLEVTLQAEPLRVVAMIPSHTETLCALGACDKLVGIDTYQQLSGTRKRTAQTR